MTLLWIFVGGAVGSALRGGAAMALYSPFPWAVFWVNTVGSFLAGAIAASALSPTVGAPLLIGFCGGLTTYSSFALQSVLLWRLSRGRALLNVLLNVCGGVLGVWGGWLLGLGIGGR